MKRILFTALVCGGTVLLPLTLIHSIPIRNLYAPVSLLSRTDFAISLPEYAKLFFIGIGLIGLGQIGRKRFLKK